MKGYSGPPMTLGNAAPAGVRLVVWCRGCGRQVEPTLAKWSSATAPRQPVPDWHARLACSGCGSRQVDFVVIRTEPWPATGTTLWPGVWASPYSWHGCTSLGCHGTGVGRCRCRRVCERGRQIAVLSDGFIMRNLRRDIGITATGWTERELGAAPVGERLPDSCGIGDGVGPDGRPLIFSIS